MFFTFGEKQKGRLGWSWRLRQIAFDTRRRYVYVSDVVDAPEEIAPPVGFPPPRRVEAPASDIATVGGGGRDAPLQPSPSTSPTASPRTQSPSTSRIRNSRDTVSSLASAVYDPVTSEEPAPVRVTARWSRKLKVDMIEVFAKEQKVIVGPGYFKERDQYRITLYGDNRKLAKGEQPPTDALLCPSTSLGGSPGRFSVVNTSIVRDPFFLQELHQGLHDEFETLRVLRDAEVERRQQDAAATETHRAELLSEVREGHIPPEEVLRQEEQLTLRSPRAPYSGSAAGERRRKVFQRTSIELRMRNEYEFRRFWFVVQNVLGFDKLCNRPHRGLPPYDPRNGLVFATIPMHVYQAFHEIMKSVMYTFIRGDLVGHSTKGELAVILKDCYLAITHEHVIVLREFCSVARWCRMADIRAFECNSDCRRPYVAFLTVAGATDIVFLPKAPPVGEEAIRHFNPEVEVLRVLEVMRRAFYASVDVRRAIPILAAPEPSVRAFVDRVEAARHAELNFDPPVVFLGSEAACDLPRERPSDAWRAVHAAYTHRDITRVNCTAVPLYDGHPNSDQFDPAVLEEMETWMERERVTRFDVVGMNEAQQQRLRAAVRLRPSNHARASQSSSRIGSDSDDDSGLLAGEDSGPYPFAVPGATYLPTPSPAEESGSGGAPAQPTKRDAAAARRHGAPKLPSIPSAGSTTGLLTAESTGGTPESHSTHGGVKPRSGQGAHPRRGSAAH